MYGFGGRRDNRSCTETVKVAWAAQHLSRPKWCQPVLLPLSRPIVPEAHLRHMHTASIAYFNEARPHQSLEH